MYDCIDTGKYDCIIVGGGPAGLSSALTLGRALKKTLVIDNNKARNSVTKKSHGFLTQDGVTPFEFKEKAQRDIDKYEHITRLEEEVENITKEDEGFVVKTQSNIYYAKRVLLSTGLKETLPNIKGLKESYGTSVFYCPWCDGYEMKDRSLLVAVRPEQVFQMTQLVLNWSKDIVVSSTDLSHLSISEKETLEQQNITLIESEVKEFIQENGNIKEVIFDNGQRILRNGAFISVQWDTKFNFLNELDIHREENGKIKLDEFGETSVKGLFVAGETVDIVASQLIDSASSGNKTAKYMAMDIK